VSKNLDERVVEGFGAEWARLDQQGLSQADLTDMFEDYFHIFPWNDVTAESVGLDIGCGSGRWAKLVAPRVGYLHCIDASRDALLIAKANLASLSNCEFHCASVDAIPTADDGADFGYSLGVLHHVPDPRRGLESCLRKLKPGAPFLVYLYFAFDNKPAWYRSVWRLTEPMRFVLSRSPFTVRYWASQLIALLVYFPLARFALILEWLGFDVDTFPLSYHRKRSFYTMRTDALDRFGTRLEQRFTKSQMQTMMEQAGLERIGFSERRPYWCAIGYKKKQEA
jgi:SAM-dependent methyltransferase